MMILKKENRIKILTIINIFLILILIFSFLPKKRKENFTTSLLNPNELADIQEIILTIPDNSLPINFNQVRLVKDNYGSLSLTGRGFVFYTALIR